MTRLYGGQRPRVVEATRWSWRTLRKRAVSTVVGSDRHIVDSCTD